MDVFISWSGTRSKVAAEALRAWLPKIINAVKPWLSSADMDKGARWSTDVALRLESAKAGIICLTPANLHADWILFEAGALSKTIKQTLVCPLLIDLEPTDITGPLAQFQATRAVKDDVLKLIKTVNTGLGDDALTDTHIDEVFEVWWPKLDAQLKALPSEGSEISTSRADRDVLEEILSLVRNQNRSALPILSEDDKKEIFSARCWKAVRSVYGLVGGSVSGPGVRGTELFCNIQIMPRPGVTNKYEFVVPANASPDEMETLALEQLKETDRRNALPQGGTITQVS